METHITFESFDKFSRKDFADRLTTIIRTFYDYYDEAFVISLNAKFGTGKTTFLKMWQNQLPKDDYKVIFINAWETDFDDEPLIPIISALLEAITTPENHRTLKKALKGALATVAFASNDIFNHVTGLNIKETAQNVQKNFDKDNLEATGEALYEEYSFKKDAYNTLKTELSKYVENLSQKPLIIFVDELDRVRPDYSVKFLEAIKHIFSLKGVCFILAVDRDQMEASVRQLYGNVDFENYYRKFITREAQLPEITSLDLMPFLWMQAKNFLNEKRTDGINLPILQNEQDEILQFTSEVSKAFRFAPRQIEALFRIFSQLMAVTQTESYVRKSWVSITILLIAIYIDNRSLYFNIGNASASPNEISEYLMTKDYNPAQQEETIRKIIKLTMASCLRSGRSDEQDQIVDICFKYKISSTLSENNQLNRERMIGQLAHFLNQSGSIESNSAFQKIYTHMEEWRAFIG